DGNLNEDNPALSPTPHVTATRIVRTPAKKLNVSFNWWVSNGNPNLDFGPRLKGTDENPFRDFRTGGLGTPERDENKYHILSNGEFDYDQVYTANIQPTDENWLYPVQSIAGDISDGFDTRYVLSFGPFYIQPGQTLPLSFAYVAGKDLHVDKDNYDNNLAGNYNPKLFQDNLNFDDLALNARWASWIYDNPGVDTDGDGYSGVSDTCTIDSTILDSIDVLDSIVIDTTLTPPETTLYSHDSVVYDYIEVKQWIKGDDVPDFKGASPPPAPDFWIEPTYDRLGIRFNGYRSETTEDIFSQNVDFEGYRIYMGRDERSESYSLITSYDRPDYNKYVYSKGAWTLNDVPYSLEELQNLYKTPVITDPLIYTRTNPYSYLDSLFYFDKQDLNASDLGTVGSIHKLYPDQPKPSTSNPALAKPEELTEDGYFKYYEYEYIIEDLLPYVQYWVNITAFDYGSPGKGLEALETSRTVGAQSSYALPTTQDAARDGEKVFIYPNPYRIDAGYRNLGLEGRGSNQRTLPDDRVRAVHFANLPAKCTISIFTLDGDLVKEIDHDIIPSDPNASHDTWDLITRNTQLVVSGIYYWTIEAENGETQVGKLVIIM
ncbi:MAG: hypothetical protein U9N55_03045, partial [candidate division Zixibacteria bacterium]|nr:hypothetical protein [candidate division Zixibacteria bacterium]